MDTRFFIAKGLGRVDPSPPEGRIYEPYGYGYTGEWEDDNGLVYLRSRYYSHNLGTFISQDPLEGFADEPASLNRYAYAQGNPVNVVDPSGLCAQPTQWWNPVDANCYYSADGLAQKFSNGDATKYQSLFDILIQKPWNELKDIELYGNLNTILNDASILPNLFYQNPRAALEALKKYMSCGDQAKFGTTAYFPNFEFGNGQSGGGGDLAVLTLGAIAVILGASAAAGAIGRSQQPASSSTYEYRLVGFPKQVGSLSEHLAKVLGYNVAGYSPSGPNPDNRATRGWCITIRRILQDYDNAQYSDKQLARDLQEARIEPARWDAIIRAVKEVVRLGICKDPWDGFNGGSLATG